MGSASTIFLVQYSSLSVLVIIRSYSAASSLDGNISFVKKLLEAFVLQP